MSVTDEQNKILSKNQFGYRKKHWTELATLCLVDEISREIDNGNIVLVLYTDLSKAFDTLSHAGFFVKNKIIRRKRFNYKVVGRLSV